MIVTDIPIGNLQSYTTSGLIIEIETEIDTEIAQTNKVREWDSITGTEIRPAVYPFNQGLLAFQIWLLTYIKRLQNVKRKRLS